MELEYTVSQLITELYVLTISFLSTTFAITGHLFPTLVDSNESLLYTHWRSRQGVVQVVGTRIEHSTGLLEIGGASCWYMDFFNMHTGMSAIIAAYTALSPIQVPTWTPASVSLNTEFRYVGKRRVHLAPKEAVVWLHWQEEASRMPCSPELAVALATCHLGYLHFRQ